MNPPGGTGSLSLHHRGNKTKKIVYTFSLEKKLITNKQTCLIQLKKPKPEPEQKLKDTKGDLHDSLESNHLRIFAKFQKTLVS